MNTSTCKQFLLLAGFLVCSLPLFSQLYINEWLASNDANLADEAGEYDDWIEIYNAGDTDINLANYYIGDSPTPWQIKDTDAARTTVPANGYLLLWADKDTLQGANHLNFKLSTDGETITLYATDGTSIIDMLSFGTQSGDISFGRSPDGSDNLLPFFQPTGGESNNSSTLPTTFTTFVNSSISETNHDAEEQDYGGLILENYSVTLGDASWTSMRLGLLFPDLNIPQGAIVENAYVQFSSKEEGSDLCIIEIVADDTDDAQPFEDSDENISSRNKTDAMVEWQPEPWTGRELYSEAQRTPNLSALIQEVLDRPGWSVGNNLAFIFQGEGTRSAYSFDGRPEYTPTFHISFSVPVSQTPVADIYINEIAANGTEYPDETGDYEDWIELYNDSNEDILVGGLFLSDDIENLTKWQISSQDRLAAGEFLTIWADEETEKGGLHADFKLSNDGETLILTQAINNQLTIIDSVSYPDIPRYATYGRKLDGQDDWALLGENTPKASNNGAGLWLAPPTISLESGAYTGQQTISISHPDPEVTIRYTMDASVPDSNNNAFNSDLNIEETTVVRAVAFKQGHHPSISDDRNYLIDTDHGDLPVLHITTDPDNLFSDETGIYVEGTNGTILGFCGDEEPSNFINDWERPANITFYEPDGNVGFDVNCGIKVAGACSRYSALKSLNIYMRNNRYGDKHINYPIFEGREEEKYKRLKLRNSGQDFKSMMMRDGTVQSLIDGQVDLDLQKYRPSVVYINGEYWGIMNMRELYGSDYFDRVHDLDNDEFDLIKNPRLGDEIKAGDHNYYWTLWDYMEANDISEEEHYNYVSSQIDVNNFTNYWISMMYIASADWPANNVMVWRPKTGDGKLRWALIDTDASTNHFGVNGKTGHPYNSLEFATEEGAQGWPNDDKSTVYIRNMLKNEKFAEEFIQRSASISQLMFGTERVNQVTDSIADQITHEIGDHIERWAYDLPYLDDQPDWLTKVAKFKLFFAERKTYWFEQVEDYFDLNGTYNLTFNYDQTTGGDVFVNSNEMDIPYNFVGEYFRNVPLVVTVKEKPGYEFLYWLETGETDATILFNASLDSQLTPIFQTNSVAINLSQDMIICADEDIELSVDAPDCDDCTFIWSNGDDTATISVSPSNSTTYSVTVSGSNGGNTGEINIEVLPEPDATAAIQHLTCFGANNGAIDLTPTQGNAPFSYNWSNTLETQDLNNLPAGEYTLTLTDANDCVADVNFTVETPAQISTTLTSTPTSCNGNNDGEISLNTTGGTGNYEYFWNVLDAAPEPNLENLEMGSYSVTILDENDCSLELNDISVTSPMALVGDYLTTPASCNSVANGAIDLSIEGGTGDYTYAWSNDSDDEDLTQVSAGTYSVTVSDENDCQLVLTALTVALNDPIQSSFVVTPASCGNSADGAIDLSVSGGAGNYQFNWNTDDDDQDLDNLAAGIYQVTITDDENCELVFDNIEVIAPAPLNASVEVQNLLCFEDINGQIDLTVTGGTGDYTYQWNNDAGTSQDLTTEPGLYQVTITDDNDCELVVDNIQLEQPEALDIALTIQSPSCIGMSDGSVVGLAFGGTGSDYTYTWSNEQIGNEATGLSAGNYFVTVTDGNACVAEYSFTVENPAGLVQEAIITATSCAGNADGAIDLELPNNSGAVTYLWDTEATTQDLENLSAGVYTVTITNDNDCAFSNTYIVTQPDFLELEALVTQNSCFGSNDASIQITNIMGGNAPYSFDWSTGETTLLIQDLAPDNYSVTLSDGNNCTHVLTNTITQPEELTATFDELDILCFGENEGYLEITDINGGTMPYDILWENGATTTVLEDIGTGDYALTITDANSCTMEQIFTISQPMEALEGDINSTNPDNQSPNSGSIDITPMGGTAPYTISLNGEQGTNFTNLAAGEYSITITDANDCTWTEIVLLELINSIDNPLSVEYFKVYPNPNNGQMTLSLDLLQATTIEVQMTDVLGRSIYTNQYQTASLNTFINLEHQAAGIYWLSIVTEEGRLLQRVVVQ